MALTCARTLVYISIKILIFKFVPVYQGLQVLFVYKHTDTRVNIISNKSIKYYFTIQCIGTRTAHDSHVYTSYLYIDILLYRCIKYLYETNCTFNWLFILFLSLINIMHIYEYSYILNVVYNIYYLFCNIDSRAVEVFENL